MVYAALGVLCLVVLPISAQPSSQAQTQRDDAASDLSPRPTGWIGVVLPLEAIDVATQADGSLQTVFVRTGDEVAKGALLARIEAGDTLQRLRIAEAELQVAEAELESKQVQARRQANRFERRSTTANLWSEEELTSSEVDSKAAEADVRAAEAQVERARANIEQLRRLLEHLEIRAPFTGHVSIRYLDPGAIVGIGTPIIRLVSGAARLVRFAVPPGGIQQLELGASVQIFDTSGLRIGLALVRHISPEIDLASQRIFVEAILDESALEREPRGGLGVEVRTAQGTAPVAPTRGGQE